MDDGVRRSIRETTIALSSRRATRGLHWALLVVGVWVIIGVVTGVLRLFLTGRFQMSALGFVALIVAFALFWVPVTFAVVGIAVRPRGAHRQSRSSALSFVAICALVVPLQPLWVLVVLHGIGAPPPSYFAQLFGDLDTNVVYFLAIVAVVHAALSYRESLVAETETARLEGALAEAHVQMLTMQLQPHFLFNTLHLVSEEMFSDAVAARRTLGDLRRLLTESFSYATRREVVLGEELSFLNAYVAIQDRRFRGRLSVSVAAAPDVHEAMVPHLLLQPLVENAIRHGIAPRAGPGCVRVRVERDGDILMVTVLDDGVGLAAAPSDLPRGLGVTQTRARLRHLYGDLGTLTIAAREGGGVVTRVNIPFHTACLQTIDASMDDNAQPVAQRSAPVRVWPSWQKAIAVVLAWAAAAVLWSQLVSFSLLSSDAPSAGWLALLKGHLVIATVGAVMSWPALHLIRALPLKPGRIGINAVGHLAGGLGLAGAHAALALRAFASLAPMFDQGRAGRRVIPRQYGRVDDVGRPRVPRRCRIHESTHLRRMASQRDARGRASSDHRRHRAGRTRAVAISPAVLLAGLDSVMRAADEGAQRCEQVIERFGDMLRRILAGVQIDVDEMRRALEYPA